MSRDDELGDEIATLSAHLDAATRSSSPASAGSTRAGPGRGRARCRAPTGFRGGSVSIWQPHVRRCASRAPSAVCRRSTLPSGAARFVCQSARDDRVATAANEDRLLELARTATGAQLERICRGYRQVAASLDDEGPCRTAFGERAPPAGGMVKLELVLHPDEAALVRAALDKARTSFAGRARRSAPGGTAGRHIQRVRSSSGVRSSVGPIIQRSPIIRRGPVIRQGPIIWRGPVIRRGPIIRGSDHPGCHQPGGLPPPRGVRSSGRRFRGRLPRPPAGHG
jgi:hypothetical protein